MSPTIDPVEWQRCSVWNWVILGDDISLVAQVEFACVCLPLSQKPDKAAGLLSESGPMTADLRSVREDPDTSGSSGLTLNTEHLSQFEGGSSHLAERPDDSLCIGFGEEGTRVQD